jgi:hypothetical protein
MPQFSPNRQQSGNIQRMANKPNGTHGPHLYLPPSSDWDLPADPGSAPGGMPASMYGPSASDPIGHATPVTESFVPETTQYRGGGIFADVSGPASQQPNDAASPPPERRGLDFSPPQSMAPPMAAPGMPDIGPPVTAGIFGPPSMGVIEHETAHTLGLSVISVAMAAVLGVKYGGLYGGIAGSLFAGAAVNAYRAFSYYKEGDEESDAEAKVSGTYAVGAAVIGAVLWTKLASKSLTYERNFEMDDDDDDDDDDDTVVANPAAGCDIRPVGP